jgi:chaperonin GroES
MADNPTPTGSRVIVEITADPEMVGSLYMPESTRRHRNAPYTGTVVRVGPGKALNNGTRRHPQVKPGDAVIWTYPAGHDGNDYNKPYADGNLSLGSQRLAIIEEDDILAVAGKP